MTGKLILIAIIATVALAAGGSSKFNIFAKPITDATTEAVEKMTQAQESRAQARQEQAQRKQRIASIVGCSADTARKSCRCYNNHGSTDTILNHEQCLAVVDRGLAALNDF